MTRFLKWTIALCIVPVSLSAQTQALTDQSSEAQEVKAVVDRFYKLELAGRWLGPSHWVELQNFFADVGPQPLHTSISVLKSYQVGQPNKVTDADGTVHYGVNVEIFEWGSINSFLRFVRAGATGEPVERRVGEVLFLTNKFVMTGPRGKEEGSLSWRIRDFDLPAGVDVDTAIKWVTEMRDKSSDPVVKYNGGRTLAILRNLSVGVWVPPHSVAASPESPLQVAQRFVRLESGLTPDQWDELANFFVETPRPQRNKVYVVDVLRVDTDLDGQTRDDSSEVAISVRPLGELDSSLRLSSYSRLPGNNGACCGDNYLGFTLLLSAKHWQIAPDGKAKELDGPLAWRIEDTLFEPFITLGTAIRYVMETRDETTDPVIKKNAVRTLLILNSYKQGKP